MNHVRSIQRFGVSLLTLWLSAAVPARSQSTPKSAADYWPFKVGSTWTFEATAGDKKLSQLITVTKVTPSGGKTRAELEYKTNGQVTQVEVYEVDAKSLVRLASGANGANKITPAFPVIQFPLTAGKKWDWKGEIAAAGATFNATSQQSVGEAETVKTAAGNFRATRVHVDLEVVGGPQTVKIGNDYWFAPGVGLVKQKATIGPQVIEGIMTSYKLAK